MLDDKRIKIAQENFKQDLRDEYIRKQNPDKNLIKAFADNSD